MSIVTDDLSDFWGDLLSRQPELIIRSIQTLKKEEHQAVISHLKRMRDDEGWHPEQRLSAIMALKVIENHLDKMRP